MADARHSPTVMRRALGRQLRELRTGAGLTVEKAAERAGISQSKLTKMELAQVVASRQDVDRMIQAYGEVGTGERDQLLAMARDGNKKEWWERRDLRLPPKFSTYLGLESDATILHAYDTTLVHGLLQTPDYARALLRGMRPDLLEHEIDQRVDSRLRRQEILTRADPPPLELWWIADEAVLRRQVGGRETMLAQLQYLIRASELPNVTLLVLPDSLGAHPAMDGPLAILEFETGTRSTVYVEGQAGNLYLGKDDDLRRCQQIMIQLTAAAPGPGESRAIIKRIAEEMKP